MAAQDKTTRTKAADEPPAGRTVTLPVGKLEVEFNEPSEGQIIALRRAGLLFKSSEDKTQARGGMLYMDVLDGLVVEQDTLDEIYQGLADNSIPLEDYAECGISLLKEFAKDDAEQAAPRHGPVASTRRARARTR